MNMDGGSSFGSYVVTGLAIIGIALGGSALYVGIKSRSEHALKDDRISELERKLDRFGGATDELQGQIRGLYNQTRTAVDGLANQIATLKEAAPARASAAAPTASASTETAAAPSGKTYTVRAGDFPARIAKANNITVDTLLKANPGVKPEKLKVGQVLNLP